MSHVKRQDYKVVKALYDITVEYPHAKILISGHTDNVGSHKVNVKLSRGRAEILKNLLVKMGLDEKRVTAKWFSYDAPIDTNKTAAGRRNNRRVVATVFELTDQEALRLSRRSAKSKEFYVIRVENQKVEEAVLEANTSNSEVSQIEAASVPSDLKTNANSPSKTNPNVDQEIASNFMAEMQEAQRPAVNRNKAKVADLKATPFNEVDVEPRFDGKDQASPEIQDKPIETLSPEEEAAYLIEKERVRLAEIEQQELSQQRHIQSLDDEELLTTTVSSNEEKRDGSSEPNLSVGTAKKLENSDSDESLAVKNTETSAKKYTESEAKYPRQKHSAFEVKDTLQESVISEATDPRQEVRTTEVTDPLQEGRPSEATDPLLQDRMREVESDKIAGSQGTRVKDPSPKNKSVTFDPTKKVFIVKSGEASIASRETVASAETSEASVNESRAAVEEKAQGLAQESADINEENPGLKATTTSFAEPKPRESSPLVVKQDRKIKAEDESLVTNVKEEEDQESQMLDVNQQPVGTRSEKLEPETPVASLEDDEAKSDADAAQDVTQKESEVSTEKIKNRFQPSTRKQEAQLAREERIRIIKANRARAAEEKKARKEAKLQAVLESKEKARLAEEEKARLEAERNQALVYMRRKAQLAKEEQAQLAEIEVRFEKLDGPRENIAEARKPVEKTAVKTDSRLTTALEANRVPVLLSEDAPRVDEKQTPWPEEIKNDFSAQDDESQATSEEVARWVEAEKALWANESEARVVSQQKVYRVKGKAARIPKPQMKNKSVEKQGQSFALAGR